MWKRSGYNPLRLLKYLTSGDILLFIVFFVGSIFTLLLVKDLFHNGDRCIIETKEGSYYSLSLSKDTTLYVKGPLGETEVRIEKGKAFIAYSPCPSKICMKMGKINREGEIVVCVPNGVMVRVAGEEELDGVTR